MNNEVRAWLASNGDLDEGKTLYKRYIGVLPQLFTLSKEISAQRCFLKQALVRFLERESFAPAIAEQEQRQSTEPQHRRMGKNATRNTRTRNTRTRNTLAVSREDANGREDANAGEDTPIGVGRIPRLQDPRLDSAPPAVRDARRRLRQIIPEASRVHLELVVASREDSPKKFDQLKRRRANLVAMLSRLMDERGALWDVIDDYLGPEEEEEVEIKC